MARMGGKRPEGQDGDSTNNELFSGQLGPLDGSCESKLPEIDSKATLNAAAYDAVAPKTAMSCALTITQDGEIRTQTLQLSNGQEATIGRSSKCNIMLDASVVSRTHCVIQRVGDYLVLIDIGSSNGTNMNGHAMKADDRYVLQLGDVITICNITLVVSSIGNGE